MKFNCNLIKKLIAVLFLICQVEAASLICNSSASPVISGYQYFRNLVSHVVSQLSEKLADPSGSWNHFQIVGWPAGISANPSQWTEGDCKTILRAIDSIELLTIGEGQFRRVFYDDGSCSRINENGDIILFYNKSICKSMLPVKTEPIVEELDLAIEIQIDQHIDNLSKYTYGQLYNSFISAHNHGPLRTANTFNKYNLRNWPAGVPVNQSKWTPEDCNMILACLKAIKFEAKVPGSRRTVTFTDGSVSRIDGKGNFLVSPNKRKPTGEARVDSDESELDQNINGTVDLWQSIFRED